MNVIYDNPETERNKRTESLHYYTTIDGPRSYEQPSLSIDQLTLGYEQPKQTRTLNDSCPPDQICITNELPNKNSSYYNEPSTSPLYQNTNDEQSTDPEVLSHMNVVSEV